MIAKGTVATNRKAGYLYKLEDQYEAGIALTGDEVKSLRNGSCDLKDAWVEVVGSEIFVVGMHISNYVLAQLPSKPTRRRKLLMHKFQIRRIGARLVQGGYTCVPVEVFFNDIGMAKVRIAIAHGKREFEHRDRIIERQNRRDQSREMKEG
jgi:SsrA-binding protein